MDHDRVALLPALIPSCFLEVVFIPITSRTERGRRFLAPPVNAASFTRLAR